MKKNINLFSVTVLAAAALSMTACTGDGEKGEGMDTAPETAVVAAEPAMKPQAAADTVVPAEDVPAPQPRVIVSRVEEKVYKHIYDTVRIYVYEDRIRWVEQPTAVICEVTEPVTQDDTLVVTDPEEGAMAVGQEPEQSRKRERFMPMTHRIDRHINDVKFVRKNEWAVGLTVSYATLNSDDSDFMLLLDDINLKGSYFKINPSVSYFFTDNISVGLRFGYNNLNGTIDNLSLDLGSGSDIDASITNVSLTSRATTYAAFLRSYAGIDKKGNFGLFGELELSVKNGMTDFKYEPLDADSRYMSSTSLQLKAAMHCGLAVYLMPQVCVTFSCGFGGLQYNKVKQMDPGGVVVGTREASQMKFKLNVADIRFGVNILL